MDEAKENTKRTSVVQQFMMLRCPQDAASTPQELWQSYTKKSHGKRFDALCKALRIPEEDYSLLRDAYTRKKKPMRFLHLHQEEETVRQEYEYKTRRLWFQRDVVDRETCDLVENRRHYRHQLHLVNMLQDEEPAKLGTAGTH